MKITTNNARRELLALFQLPEKDRLEFDYVKGDDIYCNRFVKYKGVWYDVQDTMAVLPERYPCMQPFKGWDSYIDETFFSGVLFKWGADDTVIVGSYYS